MVKQTLMRRVSKVLLVLLVVAVIWPSAVTVATSLSSTLGYSSVGGSDTSQLVGGYFGNPLITGATPGTGQDPYGNSTSPVWLIVRILPYIFAAIGILAVLGLIASGEVIASVILAALVIIITIVGLGLISRGLP